MSRNAVRDRWLHAVLCAGLSTLSMVASARAADVFKAPPPPQGETQLWIEGGAFDPGGDAIHFGPGGPNNLGFLADLCSLGGFGSSSLCGGGNNNAGVLASDPSVRGVWGWDTAAGFDHRFAGTNWHVNGELRFGLARGSASAPPLALNLSDLSVAPPTTLSINESDTVSLTEWHWQADLGIGYDVITGPSPLQVTLGLRLAEIMSKTSDNTGGALSLICPTCAPPTSAFATFSETDVTRRSFLGAGPRIGMVGSVPLYGAWTFDYKGDAAVLVGNTKISDDFNESFGLLVPGVISLSATGLTGSSYWSKWITVVNGDMQGGIGYWITPYMKLSATLRLDVFLDALRQSPDDTLPAQGIDRFYWGPQVTLTSKF